MAQKKKKTIKEREEAIKSKIDIIKRKAFEAKEEFCKELRKLDKEREKYKETHSLPINGYIIKDTEQDGTQVELEWTDLYLVEGEEWVTSKRTTVNISDMPRHKSCFRREEPGENWDRHH